MRLVTNPCPTAPACTGHGYRLWGTPEGRLRAAQCRRCGHLVSLDPTAPLTPAERHYLDQMARAPGGNR